MYLWKVEYNYSFIERITADVVNCFELCIFEKLNTTVISLRSLSVMLWIALNYVSLKSWIQLNDATQTEGLGCELLWIMYLWKVEYNFEWHGRWFWLLWIALNYVSLKSWIQQERDITAISRVVNCFELCIFEKLNTTRYCRK